MNNQSEMKVYASGAKRWYLNGKFHREDGPAIEYPDGERCWYFNGKLHRIGGPAWEWPNGERWWLLNDKVHREDGPAVECADGRREWYLNGNEFSFEDYIQELRLLGKEEAVINLLFELDSV
jgi:hypothetical protein